MNFYFFVLDDTVRKPYKQPSIGIIIYQSKNRTVIELALRNVNKPVGMSTYTYSNTLPANCALLPLQRRNSPPTGSRDCRFAAAQRGLA
jgi:hypothetical protein